MDNKQQAGQKQDQGSPSAEKSLWWFKFFDVLAKMIGALAIAVATLVVHNFESRMSVTNLLSQREQAETGLRASMLHDLVDPILNINSGPPAPQRERLLVELLALNFHDHFELKPLLENVASKMDSEGMASLEQIARRVIDRQTNMLLATAESYDKTATVTTLFFQECATIENITRNCIEDDIWREKIEKGYNQSSENLEVSVYDSPNFFNDMSSDSVCVFSPDGRVKIEIAVLGRTITPKRLNLSLNITKFSGLKQLKYLNADFWITPFDFPMTDNMRLDPKHRFAVVLYEMPDDPEQPIQLKLIWFPEGFITARERPVNYCEIRQMLGLAKAGKNR